VRAGRTCRGSSTWWRTSGNRPELAVLCHTEDHPARYTEHIIYITGWAKKVSLITFAITLSTASQLSEFLVQTHYKKCATGGYIVSPPNMVCVTALPCKSSITTLPMCLYMFTTVNNNKYKKICTLDMTHVIKRYNTDNGKNWQLLLLKYKLDFLQQRIKFNVKKVGRRRTAALSRQQAEVRRRYVECWPFPCKHKDNWRWSRGNPLTQFYVENGR